MARKGRPYVLREKNRQLKKEEYSILNKQNKVNNKIIFIIKQKWLISKLPIWLHFNKLVKEEKDILELKNKIKSEQKKKEKEKEKENKKKRDNCMFSLLFIIFISFFNCSSFFFLLFQVDYLFAIHLYFVILLLYFLK